MVRRDHALAAADFHFPDRLRQRLQSPSLAKLGGRDGAARGFGRRRRAQFDGVQSCTQRRPRSRRAYRRRGGRSGGIRVQRSVLSRPDRRTRAVATASGRTDVAARTPAPRDGRRHSLCRDVAAYSGRAGAQRSVRARIDRRAGPAAAGRTRSGGRGLVDLRRVAWRVRHRRRWRRLARQRRAPALFDRDDRSPRQHRLCRGDGDRRVQHLPAVDLAGIGVDGRQLDHRAVELQCRGANGLAALGRRARRSRSIRWRRSAGWRWAAGYGA